ncbi:acetate--CoA ligase family protein [Pelagibacterium limicola]|uniref:acetate--CoA ligase family protein n=1 Tax=Pelagibacterium limicola TaxID=2791022 RepID=UPI0018AFD9ED|nr:acetate--CoA ligase family protein [Pelagibacterium limicola]
MTLGIINQFAALDALFSPQSVAVVGASADPGKTGGRPVNYLLKHGYTGRIYPINPKADEIASLKCFGSIGDLPEAPDAAIVLLGVERAHQAVRELAARGTKLAVVLASGYGEAGAEGAARQVELLEAAGSMRVLGPNTIGAMDLHKGIVLSASGALEMENLPVGGISVASQSGGILGALLSRGTAQGIGFSKLASTGNELNVEIADLIDYYVNDKDTRVIAAYVEGIRSIDKFRAAAGRAQAVGKPLVVYKVGRSESGARAAVSHTGALAGEDRVYDALFRQTGIIRAETFGDLLNLPNMLATERVMKGKRVAVLTSTGGAGSLVADNCGLGGLDVPLLDAQTAERLQSILAVGEPSMANPVDVTLAGVRPEVMTAATEALLTSQSIDGVVVVVGSSALAQPDVAVGAIKNGAAKSDKPLIAYVSPSAPDILRDLNLIGIPSYTDPETCASALIAALPRAIRAGAPQIANGGIDKSILPSGTLNEANSRELFERFGLAGAEQRIVQSAEEAVAAARELGGKVVLKVLSNEIAHKSDVGGVRVSLDEANIGDALEQMAQSLAAQNLPAPEGYLVQKMLKGGIEMILGLRYDPQLGPFVLLGAGGVLAELTNDVAIRLLPLSEQDAQEMVDELRVSSLLGGYRGSSAYDVSALVKAVLSIANMGQALGDKLVEAEINPLFVMPEREGVAAADGLVVLA